MPNYSKNFLTSMTGHLNFDDNSDKINVGDPIPGNSNKIPLPDYKNPESRLTYAKAFKEKYGKDAEPGFGDIPLRVNEKPAWGSDTSKNLAAKSAQRLGLDPALFYASSMIEGQSGLYKGSVKGNPEVVRYTGDKDYPVSAVWSFGLDSLPDYLPYLKEKGYLPKDFDKNFKVWDKDVSPAGEGYPNESIMFKNTDAGVQAKAAMMRAFYDELDDYAKNKGIKLNPEQRDYFALAHFNSGAHGYEMLDAYNKAGLLKDNKFLEKMPNIDVGFIYKGKKMSKEASEKLHKQIYGNVSPRLAAAKGLKEEGLFD